MRWHLVALALIPTGVTASSLNARPLAERARAADRVVVAQVLSSRTEVPGGDVRKMLTHTEVLVGEVLKGPAGPAAERVTLTQLGGRHGLWESHVPGDATLVPGETALLILRCGTTPTRCGLMTLAEGKVGFVGADALVFDLKTKAHTRRPVAALLAELKAALTAKVATPAPAQAGVAR